MRNGALLGLLALSACGGATEAPETKAPSGPPLCTAALPEFAPEHDAELPKHLQRWGGLFAREGDQLVDAPAEDVAVARGYPYAAEKGPITGGRRVTILSRCRQYRVGETVRVLHVLEAVEAGQGVGIMGPKGIRDEFVDGERQPGPPPPISYDGVVLPSPAVDYNYEVTTYTFDAPGWHEIQWRPDETPASNVLRLEVVP